MKIGIVARKDNWYSVLSLSSVIEDMNHEFEVIKYPETAIYLDSEEMKLFHQADEVLMKDFDGIISRIGSGETGYPITLLRHFQAAGKRVINHPDSTLICGDKIETLQVLCKAGINVPKSFYPPVNNDESFEAAKKMMRKASDETARKKIYRILVKLMRGSGGMGISRVPLKAAPDVVETIWKTKEDVHLQEFLVLDDPKKKKGAVPPPVDIRMIVVGGVLIGGYQRVPKPGAFKANIHAGGHPKKYEWTSEQEEIALKCSDVLDTEISGVDILSNKKQTRNFVIEVNTSPGFEGFDRGARVDVAKKIVEYCIEEFKK